MRGDTGVMEKPGLYQNIFFFYIFKVPRDNLNFVFG